MSDRASLAGRLLAPRTVALVGASEASLWTQNLVANLRDLGWAGRFHLVNPGRSEQFGLPSHRSLLDLPEPVDLAFVMVGTEHALEVIEDCGRAGVSSAVMLTAGFAEVGGGGVDLEARLRARAGELGIGILGPNCLGFVNYQHSLAAYGLLIVPPVIPGGIALVSQSGAMLVHLHRMAQARAIGLARTVSIGNEAQLSASDFFEAWVDDPEVRVMGGLLEGFRDPDGFLRAADRARQAGKPMVVLKVGRSQAAQRSVAAHTASLAGEDEVVDAVFRQRAVVRVHSLEELIETCAVLATSGWPRGRRTAVVTTSGGACGLVSDLAAGTLLELPDYAPATKARLAALLPAFGTAQNPLDTTGVIVDQPDLLGDCLDAVVAEGTYDAFLVNTDPAREPGPDPDRIERRLAGLSAALRAVPYGVAVATAPVELTAYTRDALRRHGLHFANGLALGVRAVAAAAAYGDSVERRRRFGDPPDPIAPSHSNWAGEAAAKAVLEAAGIPITADRVASTPSAAAAAAAELGFPVVVKVLSSGIAHKTEVGGVRLNLASAAEVESAAAEILESVARLAPGAVVEGLLVSRQLEAVAELVVGARRDPVFGTVVVAGLGGVLVELMRDSAVALAPIGEEEAIDLLLSLRGSAILGGFRGAPPGDVAAAARAVSLLSRLAAGYGDRLRAIEINPLLVLAEGVAAADALVELA